MTAATTDRKSTGSVSPWQRYIACLLIGTITLMPAHSWAEGEPLSEEEIKKIGREAQQFGLELGGAAKLPSLTADGKIDLGEAGTISTQELGAEEGEEVDINRLKEMHDSAAAMGEAGVAAQEKLEKESNSPTPTIRGSIYELLKQAKDRPRPTFDDDKDFENSRELLSPGGMKKFMDTFTDCVAEEQFHKKEFTARIPDYQFCHTLHKPKGGCTIHHTVEIATEPADIVFLVDNSASMDAVIADLRNNINAFANLVNQGKRGNLRIGGAAIREWDYGWNKVPLTEDIGHFQRWLSGVNTESAQTHPLDAIDWATKEFQWRPNAHRIIIIIGNDDGSGNQASASHYLNVHQIKLYVFHDNWHVKALGTPLGDHFSGVRLLKFAQILTVVKDHWAPQSCIDDAAATLEGFCKGSYKPVPATENQCVTISGFEVCRGDSIYHQLSPPPLPNVHRLATRVEVSELDCSYNHGVGSCWVDPQGNKQCLQNDQDIDDCESLKKKGCVYISSECVEGAKGSRGTCYVWKQKWDCGEDVAIPTLEKSVKYRCAGPIRCMGEECVEIPREQSQDFSRAAALLQLSQTIAQDMDCRDSTGQFNVHCEIFAGKPGECKVAVGGAQNCCKKPEGVSMNDYLSLILAVPKLDTAITSLSDGNSIKTAYQALKEPLASSWTKIKSPFTSGFESICNQVKPLTESFKKVYEQTIAQLKEKASEITAKLLGKTGTQGAGQAAAAAAGKGAEKGVEEAGKKAAEEAAKKATTEAGKEALKKGATKLIGSLLGPAMTIYTVYSVSMLLIKIVWACEKKELELNVKRAVDSCHYVGTYCYSQVAGVCVESREAYCCYSSPLSRIMQEQLRLQLGLSFGSGKSPQCSGITVEKLAQIDWTKVKLDEWLAIMKKHGRLPTLETLNTDAITGSGSVLNVDGKRKNVNDRTRARMEGIDVDAIRRKAAKEGTSTNRTNEH